MRTPMRLLCGCVSLALSVLVAGPLLADDDKRMEETTTTTTTTTSDDGTVSQIGPNMIVVRPPAGGAPVTYTQTKTTTYVDENGNPVAIETVRSGVPVTVHYDESGGKMTATRVVVKKRVVEEED